MWACSVPGAVDLDTNSIFPTFKSFMLRGEEKHVEINVKDMAGAMIGMWVGEWTQT